MVLESLCDLLADDGFLPTLFASFDCDPTRSDLVQPMIQYLSQCARSESFPVNYFSSSEDVL